MKNTEDNKFYNAGGRMFSSLQQAYDRLKTIVDSSYDGIFITDGDANVLWINPAYLVISGLQEEDIMGKNMWDLEREHIINKSGTLLAIQQRKSITLEQEFQTGKRALITSTPSFGDHGEIAMVVTNVRDMTEFYDLQEKYIATKERYSMEQELLRKKVMSGAELIAADPAMLAVIEQAERVALLDTTVLLRGETGVGKENLAKHIYHMSQRREEQFFSINCGAIPANLIESELFGYEKGAFTGANKNKMGIFELADKGTIFLDEVGDLPLDMQVKLLRVLQERTIRRVGGQRDIPFDVRVIAATNRNLEEMVKGETFRKDLFYRLNVVPIMIPPLRDRKQDIVPMADSFLEDLNKKYEFHKHFARSAYREMEQYDWPGNVRELKNVVERMLILSTTDVIRGTELPFTNRWDSIANEGANGQPMEINKTGLAQGTESTDMGEPVDLKLAVMQFEHQHMEAAYDKYQNVRDAAASLGMDASTFVRKRQKYQKKFQE